MVRQIGVIVLLAVARFSLCQGAADTSKPVTYTTVAVPLRVALDSISKLAGMKLVAETDMQEEPLILRLNGVPLQSAMDKIAAVFGAKWTPTKEGFQLERTQDMVAALENADRERRLKKTVESIQKTVQDAKADGRMTKEQAGNMADYFIRSSDLAQTGVRQPYNSIAAAGINRRMAETRLLAEILATIDPAEIASLPPGGRYVYAVRPNAIQRQLPPIDEATMEEYRVDQNLISDGVTDKLKKMGKEVGEDVAQSYPHLDSPDLQVFVVFEPALGSDMIAATLEVLDSKGVSVGNGRITLGSDRSTPENRQAMRADMLTAAKSELVVSPTLKAILAHSEYGPQPDPKLAPLDLNLREALMTPTTHDPLSFGTSECVLKIAQSEDLNAVFLATDDCETSSLSACRNGKIGKELFFRLLSFNGEMEVGTADGWLIGKPLSPLQTQADRCSRETIEAYLAAIGEKGFASIEDQCALALGLPEGDGPSMANQEKRYVFGPDATDFQYASECRLRLYGSLSDAERQSAKSGLTIPVAKLSQDQMQTLFEFLFNGYEYFSAVNENSRRGSSDEMSEYQSVQSERTLAAPNGILPSDELKVKESNDDVVFGNQAYDGNGYPVTMKLEELAMQFAQAQRSDVFPWMKNLSWNNLRIGYRRQVTVTVTLRNKYAVEETIDENHPAQGPGVSSDQFADSLPADLKEKFQKWIAEDLERWKSLKPGQFPQGQPQATPPPGSR